MVKRAVQQRVQPVGMLQWLPDETEQGPVHHGLLQGSLLVTAAHRTLQAPQERLEESKRVRIPPGVTCSLFLQVYSTYIVILF